MASYSTNQFKPGLKLLFDGDPHSIVENEFVKPGKGQAFNRVRIRNLKTGKTVDKTFKSGESVEAADVMDTDMQYLYTDGEMWHFMAPDTFEQYAADAAAVSLAQMTFLATSMNIFSVVANISNNINNNNNNNNQVTFNVQSNNNVVTNTNVNNGNQVNVMVPVLNP